MSWDRIPGFSSDIEPFYSKLAKELPKGGAFIEVGVLFGRSISYLGTLRPDLTLYAVDTWENGEREGEMARYQATYGSTWRAFLEGMREQACHVLDRLNVIRARSCDVTLPGADAVFIDADHSYEAVRADIEHWGAGLNRGGLLCGHDYEPINHGGVVRAVNEAFGGKHTMGPGDWTSVWIAP